MTDRELIEKLEELRLHAYPDPPNQNKKFAVGYGHNGPEITKDTVWTYQQADSALNRDLAIVDSCIKTCIKVSLTPNMRAALGSLCYNIGTDNFTKSTLVKDLNAGNVQGAAKEFPKWCHVDKEVDPVLVSRRKLEMQIFLSDAINLSSFNPSSVDINVKSINMNKIQNTWQHPVTTIAGLVGAGVLIAAHQPNWHTFIQAIAMAVLGALAKEN
jgi:lysozyme